jgi:epidermal growth factor receptor substrate 15
MLAFAMMFTTMFTNVSFVNADDAVAVNDVVATGSAVDVLADYDFSNASYGTPTSNDNGSDLLVTYTKDSDTWKLVDTGSDTAKLTIPFAQTLSSGKVTISGTVTPGADKAAGKWAFLSLVDESGAIAVALGTNSSKEISLRVGDNYVKSTGATMDPGHEYSYTFTIDFDAKTVVLNVDGTELEDTLSATSLKGVSSMTGGSATDRTVEFKTPEVVIGDGETTTETTTVEDTTETSTSEDATVEDSTEETTVAPILSDVAKFEVKASKTEFEESEIGQEFTVDFNLSANPGVANITGWIYYDPTVVQAVAPVSGEDSSKYVGYTNADGEFTRLISASAVNTAINVTKGEFSSNEYELIAPDSSADTKAAEMGALKLAGYVQSYNDDGTEVATTNTGKIASITFKVVGTGSTEIEFMTTGVSNGDYATISSEFSNTEVVVKAPETTTETTTEEINEDPVVSPAAAQFVVELSGDNVSKVEGTNYTYSGAKVGDTVTATLSVKNNPTIGAITGLITFDSSVLKPVSAKAGDVKKADGTPFVSSSNVNLEAQGGIKVGAIATDVDTNNNIIGISDDGILVSVEFEVISAGKTDVSFDIEEITSDSTTKFADLTSVMASQKASLITSANEEETSTETTTEEESSTETESATETETVTETETETATETESSTESTTEAETESTTEEVTVVDDPEQPVADARQYVINVTGGKLLDGTENTYTFDKDTNEFIVELAIKNNTEIGISAMTGYIEYDPTVVQAVEAQAVSNDEGIAYTNEDDITSQLITKSTVKGQIENKPSAVNKDFIDLGTDGTKTQAELGRIKLAGAGLTWIKDNKAQAAKVDGIVTRIKFKVVAATDNASTVISYRDIETAAALVDENGKAYTDVVTLPSANKAVVVNYVKASTGEYSVLAGDVDNDGIVTSDDSANVALLANSLSAVAASDDQITIGDVDKDTLLTSDDSADILLKANDPNQSFKEYPDGYITFDHEPVYNKL